MKVTAKATRSGGWWAVEVPEAPGAFTQVKRLDQVAEAAAEAVSDLLEVDAATVEVEVSPVLNDDLGRVVQTAKDAAREALAAQNRASTLMREAVAALRTAFTTRDAAILLGISHQRVAQLEAGEQAPARKSAKVAPIRRTPAAPVPRGALTGRKSGVYATKAAAAKAGRAAAAKSTGRAAAASKRTSPKG
jgi:hypothetical protein